MRIKSIIYITALTFLMAGCSSAEKEKHDHDHDHSSDHNHEQPHTHTAHDHSHDHDHGGEAGNSEFEDEIVFPQEKAKTVGLKLETLKASEFSQVIKTSGQIQSAQGDEATISATTSGIVSFNKKSLDEGSAVRSGEVLINISSKHVLDGDPVVRAKNEYEVAKSEFQRAESLIKDKLISKTEYNNIKLAYDNARSAYGAFEKRYTSKGNAISSPISGYIKSKLVSEGEYVQVGQALATVTQSRRLKLVADVSERYYHHLSGIASANFKTPYDDKVYQLCDLNGKLVSYGRSVGDDLYTVPVSFEFNNEGNIIPGAYVDVYLLSASRGNVISVPKSALFEDQGAYFVFKQLDAEGYKKTEVKLGVNNGTRVEILSGVNEGDIVVAKGAIHVNLAASASALPHAHEH